jgi:hypothetical protein
MERVVLDIHPMGRMITYAISSNHKRKCNFQGGDSQIHTYLQGFYLILHSSPASKSTLTKHSRGIIRTVNYSLTRAIGMILKSREHRIWAR